MPAGAGEGLANSGEADAFSSVASMHQMLTWEKTMV